MGNEILIYTPVIQPRISYTFELVFKNLLLWDNVVFTTSFNVFVKYKGAKVNYSTKYVATVPWFLPSGLLVERGLTSQKLLVAKHNGLAYAFGHDSAQADLPFDLFAFVFYLLSRYEEYLPFESDVHGRFPASQSIAFREGFLDLPLVDLWALELKKIMLTYYPTIKLPEHQYKFRPSYDIDYAYAFRYKSSWRQIGAFLRSIAKADGEDLKLRWNTFLGRRVDPFYTFDYMLELDEKFGLDPIYFLHIGDNGPYDKNIQYQSKGYTEMLKMLLAANVPIGIHPSYESNKDVQKVKEEIKRLYTYTQKPIEKSRQHYLMLKQPKTYQNLIKLGIKEDYSMGYASQNGFRASIARSFKWYDLENEQATDLTIHPFQLMDVTFKSYKKIAKNEVLNAAKTIINNTKKVKGQLVSIWHNSSFSEQWDWKGWRGVYEQLLKEMS